MGKLFIKSLVFASVCFYLVACAKALTPDRPTSTISMPTKPSLTAPSETVVPIQPTIQTPAPTDWRTSWLKGDSCRLPCWEGITPGISSANEAVNTLNDKSFVSETHLGVSELTPDYGEITWQLREGVEGGRVTFNAQSPTQTVDTISPYFPTSVKLVDVISAYGSPTYVIATASPGPDIGSGIFYELSIVFMPIGLRLHTATHNNPIVLNGDTTFKDVIFFDPTLKEFIGPEKLLVPWQGMKDFNYYCRDEEDGQACRGLP